MTSLSRRYARARKLWGVLREPSYRRGLRYGVAASTEHEAIPLRRDFATVLDIGANRGQFALFAMHRFPQASLMCFEPLPEPRRRLEAVAGRSARVRLFDFAIAALDDVAPFHVSVADDSSSLLPIGPRQREEFPDSREQTTITVQVRRLETVLRSEPLPHPVLLKIDVQGSELDVLEGAGALLESVDVILIEASFLELYAGQALIDSVWEVLRARGFSCRGIWSVAYGHGGECLQGDLLFARHSFEPLMT